jgi:ribosomal peptide maturation radical SAM protein 1
MGAEAVRQFGFIDAAVSGEGDLIITDLVRRVLDGQSIEGLPGVRTQASVDADFASGKFSNAPTVMQMDALPVPDYDDYFAHVRGSRFQRSWQPRIFFETSRGCWWGEKMHCTFCGLNGATMQFRSKSADRALNELTHQTERYPGCDIEMTDNILDLAYFKDFIPELARRKIDLGLFYETKANLRKEQIRMMRQAGIRSVQPGIESLHDSVLKLMRKGVSALQNIQLLKWCKELGVAPSWNLLVGFPGETAEAYEWMAKVMPLLTHLPPASFIGPVRLDRFSPNYFEGEKLGLTRIEPLSAYRYVYRGVSHDALRNIAYHFEFDYQQPRDVTAYARPVALALHEWQQLAGRSDLFSIDTGDHLLVWDLRPIAKRALTVLSGAERLLYIACDAVTDMRQLEKTLASLGAPRNADEIAAMLEPLLADGLVLQDGTRYLALAVAVGDYAPAQPVVKQFYGVVKTIGVPTDEGIAVPLNGQARAPVQSHTRFPRLRQHSISTPQFKVEGSYLLIR